MSPLSVPATDAAADRSVDSAVGSPSWPIFVVSLADAADRRSGILARCRALGFTPELIDAVDGRNGLSPEHERLIDRVACRAAIGRDMSDGEYGCALSHRAIYQRICDEGLAGAVILEDDAIPTPGFATFMAQRGYLEADLIQMDHLDARVWWNRRRKWLGEITLAPVATNASLTSGYSISARGARYLLERSTPLAGLADWPCETVPLGAVVTVPRLVGHPAVELSGSALEAARDAARDAQRAGEPHRLLRFFSARYWKRWWLKRSTKKVS